MQLKTDKDVLKSILAINLDVHIWSARRKLTPEDFGNAKLPPGELASLGSKKICDPDKIRIFGTLKSRAVSLLDKSGIRFLGGWAVPESKATEIVQGLEDIAKEFVQAKNDFMSHYDQAIRDWIKRNSEWKDLIAKSVVDAGYVAQRLSFGWQVYKVVNPAGQNLDNGLSDEVTNMGNTLFDEVSKTAKEAWQKSYLGKKKITRKALSPLRSIYQKLADLSFIEPRVMPVANLIESALNKLPKRGWIMGPELLMLDGLLGLLCNPKSLTEYAQEIIEGRSNDNVLDSLIQDNKPRKKVKLKPLTNEPVPVPAPAVALDSMGLW